MNPPATREIRLETAPGPVTIRSFCGPEELGRLSMKETFQDYPSYSPIISRKETLADIAAKGDANVTLAFTGEHQVVGLALLDFPAANERWARVGNQTMMEVRAIEVSRAYRSLGISTALLRLLVDHPKKEERIFYMVGYSWTWDLEGTGLTPMEYREMMVGLFQKEGFKTYQTSEANVMMRPENLFMARIGSTVPPEVQRRFKLVRFGMET
jgi:acetoin utilization protein AcuA